MMHDGVVAENLGEMVNSNEDDYAMVLFQNRLIFTSRRPTAEGYIQGDDLWFSDREGATWSRALNYGGTINSINDEGSPYITPDGEYVYFVQCDTEDGFGDCDIYVARMDYKGKWQDIRNLGENVNSKYWDSQPYLSPDGEYLYFASDRPGGEGGVDIWRSRRLRSGRWGPARNLGPVINTSGDEKAPTVAPNGTDLFFASTGHRGHGGYDIFRSVLVRDDRWGPPVNIGRPFNSRGNDMFFRLSPREDTVFIASDRSGGFGKLDVYAVHPNPFKDTSRYIYYVRGMIYDTVTTMGIANSTLLVEPETGATFTLRTDRNGRYEFRTELNRAYSLTAMADNYDTVSTDIRVPPSLYYNEYRQSIGLAKPVTISRPETELPPADVSIVYFDFDKHSVLPEYRSQLVELVHQRLQPLMQQNVEFSIVLDAHTDEIGSEQYNLHLSRRRGAAVSAVLRAAGVPVDLVRINAYGKSRPATTNETDEGRALNRRVELQIQLP